jgi:hypothetical protein
MPQTREARTTHVKNAVQLSFVVLRQRTEVPTLIKAGYIDANTFMERSVHQEGSFKVSSSVIVSSTFSTASPESFELEDDFLF